MLYVHDIKPPFLDGRMVFTRQTEAVQVVRDPNSDFAVLAKKGSHVLKFVRERADRQTMRDKFWEISGTKLGNILKAPSAAANAVGGIKEEDGSKEKA